MLDVTQEPTVANPDGPDFYVGASLEVGEIIIAMNKLVETVRDMKACFDAKQTVSVKISAEAAAKHAWAISIMTSHIARVAAEHAQRKAQIHE